MRNILNVIVDMLTLLAIAIAGIGHMLLWFNPNVNVIIRHVNLINPQVNLQNFQVLMDFQSWHALRSGISLGVLCFLIFLSLAFSWRAGLRRILVLLMFAASLAAVIFITLAFSPYPLTEAHRRIAGNLRPEAGFFLALVPTCFASGFCLLRMLWTMPPVRPKAGDKPAMLQALPVNRETPSPAPEIKASHGLPPFREK